MKRSNVDINAIVDQIAAHHGVTSDDITGWSRKAHIKDARTAFYAAARNAGVNQTQLCEFMRRDVSYQRIIDKIGGPHRRYGPDPSEGRSSYGLPESAIRADLQRRSQKLLSLMGIEE